MSPAAVPSPAEVRLVAAPAAGAPRVSLRVVADGQANDLVGHVLGGDDTHLVVLPADRGPQWVRRDQIRARREVPGRVVRPVSTPLDLERVVTHGWPGTESFRLGGWLLRTGGGWTGRANSCLVAGDPGLATRDALEVVTNFYRHRHITPQLHITLDADGHPIGRTRSPGPTVAEVHETALATGWLPGELTTVMVRDIADAAAPVLPDGLRLVWESTPDERWLGLFRGGGERPEQALPVLGAAPARYLTVLDQQRPVAIGRSAAAEDWAGISCVEVHPAQRRRGLGRLVTEALLATAGAPFGYLQVVDGNTAAIALYEQLGFAVHHRYRYLSRPDPG